MFFLNFFIIIIFNVCHVFLVCDLLLFEVDKVAMLDELLMSAVALRRLSYINPSVYTRFFPSDFHL